MKHLLRIASIAVRELVFERVFYLLLAFALLAQVLSLLLGQLTYVNQTKLTLDFMLGGTQISMVLFAVFMGIGLFKRELTMGSVSMVLSKPIHRSSFVLGKYLGQIVVQACVILAMSFMTIYLCSRSGSVSIVSILQTSTLIFFEVAILTAVTYLAAVNFGAVTTALISFVFFVLGHLRQPITSNAQYKGEANWVWAITRGIFPDLEVFNMKMLASYGDVISWAEFGWVSAYALVCICFFLTLASVTFSQKDIFT